MFVLVAAMAVTACGNDEIGARASTATTVEADRASFELIVSNQSFENERVAIAVTIDGSQLVAEDFDVEDQHNFVSFSLDIPPGDHDLVARAEDGTTYSSTVSVPPTGRRYGVLYYWADQESSARLTFEARDRRPGFK